MTDQLGWKKAMAAKRPILWNSKDSERYRADAERAVAGMAARRDGVHTAGNLDETWRRLGPAERLMMEYLLLIGSPTVVSLHNDGFLDAVVDKGLLQKPIGVASVFLNYHDTTYDVPPAVWSALNANRARFLPDSPAELDRLRTAARARLKDQIRVFEPPAGSSGT
ncbi:MAG: hypothetical protein AAB223_12340 [Pseudomonadota bacterium]